jgi:hypothetical protein
MQKNEPEFSIHLCTGPHPEPLGEDATLLTATRSYRFGDKQLDSPHAPESYSKK